MLSKSTLYRWMVIVAVAVVVLPVVTFPCAAQSAVQGTIASGEMVTDVIVGRNNKGPYTLSWTNVDLDSLSVVINGRGLRKNQDFRIDSAKGMLSFDSVLVNDAIVRVSYRTIPGKSERTAGKLSIPVSLQLFQRQDTNFHVTGLYAQDDPKNPDARKTVVGLGGEKKWAGGKADSLFLIGQRTDAQGTADQGSLWDRAGVRFAGDTNLGGVKLTASYLHSGNEFAGAKEYNLGLGKHLANFAAEFAPSSVFQSSATFQESEDTAGKTKGKRSLLNEQKIVYSPLDSTKLSLVHSQTENATAAAGSERSVDSNLIRLDQSIGSRTAAVATFEDASITAAGKTEDVQTRALNLTSTINSSLSFRGGLTQKLSDLYGKEQGLGVGFTAAPSKQVKVDVDVGTLDSELVGHQTSTDVKVTTSPIPQLAIQAGYSGTDSSKLGEATRTNLSFQANPLGNLQFQGALIGNAQSENERFQRNFTLSSSPTSYAKLSALFSQKGVNDLDDVTKGAALELTPVANTQISAGYRYIETGAEVMEVRDYAAAAKPWSFFSVKGSLRDRESVRQAALDSADLALSLAPVRYFTLTGSYQANPENKKGAIQNYRTAAVGLKTNIGSVGLVTNYAEKDEYQLERTSEQRKVGLEVPAFGHGKLTTGYELGRLLNGSDLCSETYLLGYQHSVGSDFNLSLTGRYTRWLQDQMLLPEKTEYSAEASLGVKF